jgi:hypothetical protein
VVEIGDGEVRRDEFSSKSKDSDSQQGSQAESFTIIANCKISC